MQSFSFQISGITFRLRDKPELATYRPAGPCTIEPEPTNKFDALALQVINNGEFIGYIPGPKSKFPHVQPIVHQAIKDGAAYTVEVESYCYKDGKEWNEEHRGKLGAITLKLTCDMKVIDQPVKAEPVVKKEVVEAPPKDEPYVKLKSFNEDVEVLFFEKSHRYFCGGKQLTSVTRAVGSMYEPFDAERIAGYCEKKYDMKAADILDMWDKNGIASAGFGTAMHEFMENYQLYGEQSLPKMPLLRNIITSFKWWEGEVHTEVLITSVKRGMCGLCDRLMVHKGMHIVADYKFNYNATETKKSMENKLYPAMVNNKVTKYVCQMSIYAEMLEETGLQVSDVVCAHVFDGKWTDYAEKRIKGILDKVTS